MYKSFVALACAAAVFAPLCARAGEVHERQIHQEQRIAQGVRSGSLSPREAARLQFQENRLAAQRRAYLRDGDGRDGLTRGQAVRLNREQNRLSREIYREKHDRDIH